MFRTHRRYGFLNLGVGIMTALAGWSGDFGALGRLFSFSGGILIGVGWALLTVGRQLDNNRFQYRGGRG